MLSDSEGDSLFQPLHACPALSWFMFGWGLKEAHSGGPGQQLGAPVQGPDLSRAKASCPLQLEEPPRRDAHVFPALSPLACCDREGQGWGKPVSHCESSPWQEASSPGAPMTQPAD